MKAVVLLKGIKMAYATSVDSAYAIYEIIS